MRSLTAIALVDGDSIVWSKGFGFTNRAQKEKVTGDTLFHVGSISKSFTALGVLHALSKGVLTLDDPVKQHLHGFASTVVSGRRQLTELPYAIS